MGRHRGYNDVRRDNAPTSVSGGDPSKTSSRAHFRAFLLGVVAGAMLLAIALFLHGQDGVTALVGVHQRLRMRFQTKTTSPLDHHTLSPPLGFQERCSSDWDEESSRFTWSDDDNTGCCNGKHNFKLLVIPEDSIDLPSNVNVREVGYYWGAPFGNQLTKYYNDRALAYVENQTFVANRYKVNENNQTESLREMIACFPSVTSPSQSPYHDKFDLIRSELQKSRKRLVPLGYPHSSKDAAFHLMPKLISDEVQSIAQTWSEIPALQRDLPGKNTLVVHLRCNQYILDLHEDYGILPHRYYLDRIAASTKDMVIVHMKEDNENACMWSLRDLVEQASTIHGLNVTVRSSPDPYSDWVYMTRAPTLVCSPSTFCLTAAWGNPNSVYVPTCGGKSALASPDQVLSEIAAHTNMSRQNFHWVSMDFLPGKAAAKMEKSDVLLYVRSKSCNKIYGCVADPPKEEEDQTQADKDTSGTHTQSHPAILPPPANNVRPDLPVNSNSYSQASQDRTVLELSGGKSGGVFVEIGGFDGITYSNTLRLEEEHGWSGLLIEADSGLCSQIRSLKRNITTFCGCLADSKTPTIQFRKGGALGGDVAQMDAEHAEFMGKSVDVEEVKCMTPEALFDFTGMAHIDYFSLDVEGAELMILELLLPLLRSGALVVDIWTIEYRVYGGRVFVDKTLAKLSSIRELFQRLGGYDEWGALDNEKEGRVSDSEGLDVVFVRKGVRHQSHSSLH